MMCVVREPFSTNSQPVAKIDPSTAQFDLLQISPAPRQDPYLFWVTDTKLELLSLTTGLNKVNSFNSGPATGPRPASVPGPASGPGTGFPYPRLGGTTSVDDTEYFLYHQLNETAIAQEKWTPETGVWTMTTITLPT